MNGSEHKKIRVPIHDCRFQVSAQVTGVSFCALNTKFIAHRATATFIQASTTKIKTNLPSSIVFLLCRGHN